MKPLFVLLAGVIAALSQTSPTVAQTATERLSGNPREAYAIVKSYLIADNPPIEELDVDEGLSEIPIVDCLGAEQLYVVEGALRSTLVGVAFDVTTAEGMLKLYRYPESMWRKSLDAFEERQLSRIESGFRFDDSNGERYSDIQKLSDEINRNIRDTGRNLKPTSLGEDCGGGASEIMIQTRPRNAKAYLMPELYYRYCQEIGLDPADEGSCNLWHAPVADGDLVMLGGIYRYRMLRGGKWSKISAVDFDRYNTGDTVRLPR